MKFKYLLTRTETTSIQVEIDALNELEGYEKAWDMLRDEDNPINWDDGEVVHAEEDVLHN